VFKGIEADPSAPQGRGKAQRQRGRQALEEERERRGKRIPISRLFLLLRKGIEGKFSLPAGEKAGGRQKISPVPSEQENGE